MSFVLFFCIPVFAGTCQSDELKRLKELANKVEFTYDYSESEEEDEFGTYTITNFKIKASNLSPDLEVMIINNYYTGDYRVFKYNSSGEYELDGFDSGEKVTITIKGYVPNGCSGKDVLVRTINLPYYNSFSKSEECKSNPEFKYCSKLLEKSVSDYQFYVEYEKYTETGDSSYEGNEENNKSTNYNNYIIIGLVGVGLVLLIVVIMVIAKKRKRNQI